MNLKLIRQAIIAAVFVTVLAAVYGNAQTTTSRTNTIFRPCPSTTTTAKVSISTVGAITLSPCSGKSTTLGGSAFTIPDTLNFASGTTLATRGANGEISFMDSGQTSGFALSTLGQYLNIGSSLQLGFTSTGNPLAAAADVGLARYAAGVLRTTNGGTSITGLYGGGAAVASAAALPLPTGNVFHVTGTTSITSITSTNFASGMCINLIFDGILTVTDGGNLKLAGNFVTTADDTLQICYDGSNWYEIARAVN